MDRISKTERDDLLNQLKLRKDRALAKVASENPEWERQVKERAQKLAIGHLKIERELKELDAIRKEIDGLRQREKGVEKQIAKKLPRKDKGRYDEDDACRPPMDLCEAMNVLTDRFYVKAKASNPQGKKADAIEDQYLNDRASVMRAVTRDQLPKGL